MINDLFIYSVLITVNRPPTHFSTKLLHSESSKLSTPTTNPLSDTMPNLSSVTGNTTGIVRTLHPEQYLYQKYLIR